MRKYFLWSAVALMLTTTANATTDYAEVTAKATIEVAGTLECDDLDFGTIVVKQNNEEMELESNDWWANHNLKFNDIISLDADGDFSGYIYCGIDDYMRADKSSIPLISENGDEMQLKLNDIEVNEMFLTTLVIPAKVKAGTYTGSFTITHTY